MRKTAIVTGASRGIGRECAIKLSESFNVVINYNKSIDNAKEVCDKIRKNGGECDIFCADVSNFDECKRLTDFTYEKYGGIYALVNNAGIAEQKVFCDINLSDWRKVMSVNLDGAYNMIQCVLPYMINQKKGKIVNISSVWGLCGASCEVHYSASKAGIIGLTKALAKELGLSKINVNAVAPGVIKTDMCSFDDETNDLIKSEIPLGKFGSPKDVAAAVDFLCSEKSDYITGEVINVSGGYVI